ncbi:hypothetical protein DdX_21847 [Ditylenchus destructor]|uniref:Uncharacterized protein n=1 Tax=Ditylenchus destructor TaxID=166010 RepID=A0AAD4MEC3_9BILA|nr:hypothetical protein DdX_21847 [Ditylenchus destructor]
MLQPEIRIEASILSNTAELIQWPNSAYLSIAPLSLASGFTPGASEESHERLPGLGMTHFTKTKPRRCCALFSSSGCREIPLPKEILSR